MNGKKEFFVSKEEVLETWRILAPVQEAWQQSSADLFFYPQGSDIGYTAHI
jgi:glucose-6-phosphate 1-dehydrogenase